MICNCGICYFCIGGRVVDTLSLSYMEYKNKTENKEGVMESNSFLYCKNKNCTTSLHQLASDFNRLKSENASLNSNIKKLKEENETLKREGYTKSKKIEELENQLNQPCPAYLRNKKKLKEAEESVVELHKMYVDERTKKIELQKQLDVYKNEMDKMACVCCRAHCSKNQAIHDNAHNPKRISELVSYINNLSKKINESNRINNAKTEQIKNLESKIAGYKLEIIDLKDRLYDYQAIQIIFKKISADNELSWGKN